MEEPVDELRLVAVMLPEDAIEKEVGSVERSTVRTGREREVFAERERKMAAVRVKEGSEEREDVGEWKEQQL